jgi:hypothetical protein
MAELAGPDVVACSWSAQMTAPVDVQLLQWRRPSLQAPSSLLARSGEVSIMLQVGLGSDPTELCWQLSPTVVRSVRRDAAVGHQFRNI